MLIATINPARVYLNRGVGIHTVGYGLVTAKHISRLLSTKAKEGKAIRWLDRSFQI